MDLHTFMYGHLLCALFKQYYTYTFTLFYTSYCSLSSIHTCIQIYILHFTFQITMQHFVVGVQKLKK